ncbi:ATP-dependent helicase/deoxyribonuclease subunit B [Polystyrenella longa]|uniref:ATP-dependent helicase/deoxyribonuclease subunit B n=1 Tax=Polystyrenella longa TaxID=2528007 RepID=A0A518CQZ8_9PLAN|nr:PD-(D/E)XK nuclease family protein [Polystyrenella longa]QDU81647.1 ATP-dependent helicase/deoxyribonuclease subunit B [Polystyrenella longa]
MLAEIEILTGIAGVGKTNRLLAEYQTALQVATEEKRIPRLLWLTPTLRSRELVRQQLFADSRLKGCFAPNILTFDQFAELILRHGSEPVRFLSDTAKRLVVRSLIDQQMQDKELTHFRKIAHTEGYLELACQFISELKRDEIWPEHFLETCHQHLDSRRKDCELGDLYLRYQNFLHNPSGTNIKLYDAEGRFWSARDALERGEYGPFAALDLIIVDGFTDFTFTQYGILDRLADRAKRMLISLPLEDPLARKDLFAKTIVGRTSLKKAATRSSVQHLQPDKANSNSPPAIQFIARNLFLNPRKLTPSTEGTGIELIAAIGPTSEAEYIAREAKQLLLQGVDPGQIVICFRSLKEDSSLLMEILSAAGVPYYSDSSTAVTELPLTKALFSILQLEQEDWSYDRLMKLIDSNFFRPSWKGYTATNGTDTSSPAIAISTIIRRSLLGEGRYSLLRKLNWLVENEKERAEEQPEETSRETFRNQLAIAAAGLNRLSDVTAPLRKRKAFSFAEWIEQLVLIARELGLQPVAKAKRTTDVEEKDSLQQQRQQWDFLEKSLFDAIRFCQQFQIAQQKISLTEFQSQLIHILQRIRFPQPQRESGVIRLLEASQVRNLEIDYLFLAGMTEGSFPQGRNEDCIYSEAERLQFHEWDIPLGHSATQTQEEMLLFYSIITRARKRLILSYPSVNTGGEPLFPAPYYQSVRELFSESAVPVRHVGSLNPLPDRQTMFTSTDLRLVATEAVRLKHPELFATLFTSSETTPAARTILATTNMAHARFHTHGFTPFEGLLDSTYNRNLLSEHFVPDYQFSTRQLENYAECPFRFMYAELFRLQSLDPPEIKTDYKRRGIITHDILAALHRQYQEEEPHSSHTLSDEAVWVQDLFQTLTTEKLINLPSASELEQVLMEVEQELFQQWGEAFGQHWTNYAGDFLETWDERPVPRFVELPFGEVPTEKGDFEILYESVPFGNDSGEAPPVRIRGRIDRIDVGQYEGKLHFNVIDFKTGSVKKVNFRDILSGRKLQLAIYTLAVQRLGLISPDAVPFDLGYWLLNEDGYNRGITNHPQRFPKILGQQIVDRLSAILDELLPKLASEIRAGEFPVFNEDVNCGQRCEFRTICRVGQIRSLPDSLDKQFQTGIEEPTKDEQAEQEGAE